MTVLHSIIFADVLGTAAWLWLTFLAIVIALLAFDLGVLHREHREINVKESLLLSAGYISMGLLFSVWVYFQKGADASMDYLTGFLIEKSLSMDNVFVIALIFRIPGHSPGTSASRTVLGNHGCDRAPGHHDRLGRSFDRRVQLGSLYIRRLPAVHGCENAFCVD